MPARGTAPRPLWRLAAGGTAGALLVGMGVTGPATAAPPGTPAGETPAARIGPAQTAPAGPGAARTLTLVTGDRVTVSADGRVAAEPGPGRSGISFTVTTAAGHARVVPSDAGPLLAAGRLDGRLFDITGLLAAGYDRRDDLPLIVTGGAAPATGPGAAPAATGTAAARAGVTAVDGLTGVRDLPAIGGVAVRQPRARAVDSWRALRGGGAPARTLRPGLGKVWLDGTRKPTLDVSVPRIGAPAAWQAGYTGSGSTVAVLDTGVDDTHPDLAGQVVGRRNFTEEVEPDADLSGHGTHVASTIAGTGAASGGRYRGVAPGAKLLDGKVCVVGGCAESWIVAGMTWAAAERQAKVVNLSLGGSDDPAVVDPVEQAVQDLSARYGTLFVVAAGNSDGGVAEGIDSPGSAEAALTVGAVDDRDAVADFSRRGPGPDGSVKPEITAPGVAITAARGRDATEVPGSAGDPYTTISGTSMAAPHVAGAAAILAQLHGDWTGQRLKAALVGSAKPHPAYGVFDQGAGRVDVARAVGQGVTADSASIGFGTQLWPHGDDPVLTRKVTYRNSGTTDVTLAVRPETTNPDGTPTPAGMFTVDTPSLPVPAGGEASVTVTVDTRVPGPDGTVGGWLTATAGTTLVRTPLAVRKEVESYEVTLTHTGRDGLAPERFTTQLTRRDSATFQLYLTEPTTTVRLPKAHYTLVSGIFGGARPASENATLLAQPDLYVDGPRTVDLDARLGAPVSVTVPRASARQVGAQLSAYSRRPGGTAGITLLGDSFADRYTARVGPDSATDDGFVAIVAGQWAQAGADGGTDDSPYLYALLYPLRGRMPTGYRRSVTDRELAQVRAHFALAAPGTSGSKRVRSGLSDFEVGGFGPDLAFRLPFSRTEFYNTDAGVEFAGDFDEWSGPDVLAGTSAAGYTAYRSGGTYVERWNRGVFAPALPDPGASTSAGAVRSGDELLVDVPLYGDGEGRPGYGTTSRAGSALFRNGTEIARTEQAGILAEVPPDDASYRLELHAERDAPFALSTRTDVAWTFRSGHVDGAAPAALPLWSIRFSPDLDRYDTAPAGRAVRVPVSVAPQPGAPVGALTGRTVEFSLDDGATWRPTPLVDGAVVVPHPAGDGFVSLRGAAVDAAGNRVELTVIRAYRYGTVR